MLLAGAIFFSLASITRQMLPNYVGGALLLIGYLLSGSLLTDIDNKTFAALIDPFGIQTFSIMTRYWSIAEKNNRIVPLSGLLLANRAIWVSLGLAIFAFAFSRFRFAHVAVERKRKGRGRMALVEETTASVGPTLRAVQVS